MVPEVGLEPAHHRGYWILSLPRLLSSSKLALSPFGPQNPPQHGIVYMRRLALMVARNERKWRLP